MNKVFEKFLQLLIDAGIILPDKAEAAKDKMKELNLGDENKFDSSKITDPNIKAIVEALTTKVDALTEQNKSLTALLTKEQETREKSIKAQEDRMKAEKTAKVQAAVDKAIKEGKFPEAKRATLLKQADADPEGFEDMVSALPARKEFKVETKKEDGTKTPEIMTALSSGNPGILSKIKEYRATAPAQEN